MALNKALHIKIDESLDRSLKRLAAENAVSVGELDRPCQPGNLGFNTIHMSGPKNAKIGITVRRVTGGDVWVPR